MHTDLERFLKAQEASYATALAEIQSGRKRSHWMWYIFPQIQGLGRSATAQYYAIRGEAEARAYMAHPLLAARLREISAALLALENSDAREIFSPPDDSKLRSSMTLFYAVSGEQVFQAVLDKFFGGREDARTRELLGGAAAHRMCDF